MERGPNAAGGFCTVNLPTTLAEAEATTGMEAQTVFGPAASSGVRLSHHPKETRWDHQPQKGHYLNEVISG